MKAQQYHDRLKVSLWEEERLGIKLTRSWQDAVLRFIEETSHKKSHKDDLCQLRWLDKHLRNLNLQDINRDVLDALINERKRDGVSNATVRHTMAVVRTILRRAVQDWEWLDKAPKVRMPPVPKRRIRWLTHSEAQRLVSELPEHLAAMVCFSLETGLRQSNVTGLKWSQVDLARRCAWIHADEAKAGQAIPVPLSSAAVVVIRKQIGKHPVRVFSYMGKPVSQVNTKAWHKALKRAGINDFRWHDLRHTWASWHVQAGTPLHVLQELGGWESAEMVRRYAHLSSEHLLQYAERGSHLRLVSESAGVSTVLSTVPEKEKACVAASL
jgi:integrase